MADPKLLTLDEEVAKARLWFARYEAQVRARAGGGDLSYDESEQLRLWLEHTSRIVERAHKITHGQQYTITLQGLTATLARIGEVINVAIDSGAQGPELKRRIAEGFRSIVGRDGYTGGSLDPQPELPAAVEEIIDAEVSELSEPDNPFAGDPDL